MKFAASSSKSPIELLPIETQQAILSSLTDIASLQQCALSCPTLYSSYKAAEKIIISQVLFKQIGIGVLPEAVMALSSSRLKFIELESFTSANFQKRQPAPEVYTFKDALLISNFHLIVEFLTRDFVHKALAASPFMEPSGLVVPATPTEIDRIQRAFYMFEIYRNIFTRHYFNRQWRSEAQQGMFFQYFSAWQNEQLACVHDYLVQIVIPGFNEIAAHDVLWGSTNIKYATGPNSQHIQAILSQGLAHLHEIAMADSYAARRKLMYKPYPPWCDLFLFPAMFFSQSVFYPYDLNPSERIVLKQDFYRGDDSGPEYAWRWGRFYDAVVILFDSTPRARQSRRWAYVMWDRRRLDRWGVFAQRWSDTLVIPSREERELEREEGERMHAEMISSWKRREVIHLAGGYGWWEAGDEGRVEWVKGKSSPWDDEAKRRDCDLCLGAVRCAPHRLVLKIKTDVDC
ncbi:hypothetical protein IFR05_012413 [Cadophora sp. M221]|nr:hypothetical protein IFR05_012413 [Cadophora sp. M221]